MTLNEELNAAIDQCVAAGWNREDARKWDEAMERLLRSCGFVSRYHVRRVAHQYGHFIGK